MSIAVPAQARPALPPEALDPPLDWAMLRTRRSRWWRPGENTRYSPWMAMAETNQGWRVVPCGRDVEQARELVARWRLVAMSGGDPVLGETLVVVGAAVVDPRGDIHDGWKLPVSGSMPNPAGSPRWEPLRRTRDWETCRGCKARRHPGCYVALDGGGCTECMPARETDDPRVWPVDPPRLGVDPATVKASPRGRR